MELRRLFRAPCHCSKALPFSTALLFLSAILPSSSFAQLTEDPAPTTSSTRPSTTFQTSTYSSPTSTPPASQTQSNAAATTSSTEDDSETRTFNYYFLIIAIVAICFCLAILYMGRRRRRKQAIIRANSQRALAQDVAGFRQRFGRPRPGWGTANTRRTQTRVEGLDERGEAPPPYAPPSSKPPSISNIAGVARPVSSQSAAARRQDDMELGDMNRLGYEPPGYHEHPNNGPNGGEAEAGVITRPETALTAHDRFGSSRRLLNGTESTT